MWILLALLSSLFLGFYDVAKKTSLKQNAVIPVLFFASATGALVFIPFLVLSQLGVLKESFILYVPNISAKTHFLIFLKSTLVGSSWYFAYVALKYLPLTIVTPIRATGPFWTLIGALIIYNEQYTLWQWLGIVTILIFFYLFSLAGLKEGISFKRNKWIYAIITATILGACSGLYDKFLMRNFHPMAVQTWFSIYLIPVFLPFLLLIWFPKRKSTSPFVWRYSIILIGVLLAFADFAYFKALTDNDSLIAVVSVLRRTSVIIAFVAGAIIFKEVNIKRKAFALLGILTGVLMIALGS